MNEHFAPDLSGLFGQSLNELTDNASLYPFRLHE
jgi:hypothetical protein